MAFQQSDEGISIYYWFLFILCVQKTDVTVVFVLKTSWKSERRCSMQLSPSVWVSVMECQLNPPLLRTIESHKTSKSKHRQSSDDRFMTRIVIQRQIQGAWFCVAFRKMWLNYLKWTFILHKLMKWSLSELVPIPLRCLFQLNILTYIQKPQKESWIWKDVIGRGQVTMLVASEVWFARRPCLHYGFLGKCLPLTVQRKQEMALNGVGSLS